SSRRGAETRECESANMVSGELQRVHGLAGHQKAERRVESAGDADGHRRLADVLQALGQSGHLDMEDLFATLPALLLDARDERVWVDHPCQPPERRSSVKPE